MPERVRTVFDDEGNSIPNQTSSDQPKTSADPSQQTSRGKKRKRFDTKEHGSVEPAISQEEIISLRKTPDEYDHQNRPKLDRKPRPNNKSARPQSNGHDKSLREKREKLLKVRKELPIWPHADNIRQCLRNPKHVMLLVGETGSGKSTQVPQFLLSEPWCNRCIAITQPRRVAAISLARRVADEMGTPLGSSSPASKVGYSVRFDNSTSPSTKIKFLTEGMLLQEMLRDPWLRQYSAVIVDEVHERSVNVDLILGFLRNLVTGDLSGRKGDPLKVVVMSATVNTDHISGFFDVGFRQVSNADVTPSEDQSESSWSGISSDDDNPKAQKLPMENPESDQIPNTNSDFISVCRVQGRQFPVKLTYLPEPTLDFVEAALKAVFQIHYKEPLPGDILVFLTGQDTVESLERLINEYATSMGSEVPKIHALPLFAALPQSAQQKVFQPVPPNARKVILSTNIAETSVTVPGVKFVVDSGKVKMKQFRNRLGLDSLLVKSISQSSAVQRMGRAGREAPGKCFRLYTEKDYLALSKSTIPEILRCDLTDAVLGMKARNVDDILNFPFLDPPPREALEKALLQLLQLGALSDLGAITDDGLKIAKLPLTPALGRVIIEASRPENDCLVDIINILSCLGVESIFLNLSTEEKKEEAEIARRELFRREGDHLTLLATVKAYAAEEADRKAWSQRYFVSHRAMQNVMDVRKQLFAQCKQLGLLSEKVSINSSDSVVNEAQGTAILKSLLRGFASNTARLMPDGSYKTVLGNQTVSIHPSSVIFGKKAEAIMFSEFVFTNKSYGRNVSMVRLGWIDEVMASGKS